MKGYDRVETITDSRLAVARFVATRPDLVLLDLRMPHLSGLEVLEEPMGAKDFLNKPFDAVEVLLRIRNLRETRFLYLQLRDQNALLDRKVRDRTRELEESQLEALSRLALAAEYRDDQTGEHTRRVGQVSALMARASGLSDVEVELIRQTAPLHDIGKIGIPDAILLKPGRLTPAEGDEDAHRDRRQDPLGQPVPFDAAGRRDRALPPRELGRRRLLRVRRRAHPARQPHVTVADAFERHPVVHAPTSDAA